MLVSTIQQSESAVTYTYIPSFFGFSTPFGHQRAVSRVPWTIQKVPISHIYTRVWICFSMIPLMDTECRMDWKGEESRSMEVSEKSVVRGTVTRAWGVWMGPGDAGGLENLKTDIRRRRMWGFHALWVDSWWYHLQKQAKERSKHGRKMARSLPRWGIQSIDSWPVQSRVWETWSCSYRAVRSNSSQVMLKAREEWGHPGRSRRIRERGDRLLGRFTVIWGELKMWKGGEGWSAYLD